MIGYECFGIESYFYYAEIGIDDNQILGTFSIVAIIRIPIVIALKLYTQSYIRLLFKTYYYMNLIWIKVAIIIRKC